MCRADETQLTGLVGTVQPCILDRCLSRRTSHAKKPKKKAIRSLHQLRSAVDTAAERALAILRGTDRKLVEEQEVHHESMALCSRR